MNDLGALYTRIEADTKGLDKAETRITAFAAKAGAALAGAFTVSAIAKGIRDVTTATARFDTLGVVMNNVGKNAGYSSREMAAQEENIRKAGISMTKTREILTRMTQAEIDLSKSTDLARVAQNAAVIGNLDSSEAYGRLIYGIQSAQTEILRNIGINVNFQKSYKDMAAQLGKNVSDLTEYEKVQARTNAVLKEGEKILGTYEASMETPMKKWLSLNRHMADAKVLLGRPFQNAFGEIVDATTDSIKSLNETLKGMDLEFVGQVLGDIVHIMVNMDEVSDKLDKRYASGESWINKIASQGLEQIQSLGGKSGGPILGPILNQMDRFVESLRRVGLDIPTMGEALDAGGEKFKKFYKDVRKSFMTLDEIVDANMKEVLEEKYVDPWMRATDAIKIYNEEAASSTKLNLDDMKSQYDKFSTEIKDISDKIQQNQMSGQETIRSIQRSGMSEINAWRDLRKEAQEFEALAKKAAASSDFDKALEYADKAESKYADLNKQIKSGDKVILSQKTGMNEAVSGIKRVIALRDEALKTQQQIKIDAANALVEQGGAEVGTMFEDVIAKSNEISTISLPKIVEGWNDVADKGIASANRGLTEMGSELDVIMRKVDQLYEGVLKVVEAGSGSISGDGYSLGGVIRRATGGPIFSPIKAQFGRYFSGFGGGDRIPILGEAGEYMLNKFSVRSGGVQMASDFNNQNWEGVAMGALSKLGPSSSVYPSVSPGRGVESSFTSAMSNQSQSGKETPRVYNIGSDTISVRATEDEADKLYKALNKRSIASNN